MDGSGGKAPEGALTDGAGMAANAEAWPEGARRYWVDSSSLRESGIGNAFGAGCGSGGGAAGALAGAAARAPITEANAEGPSSAIVDSPSDDGALEGTTAGIDPERRGRGAGALGTGTFFTITGIACRDGLWISVG